MAQGLLSAYLVVGSDELKRETAVRRLRSRVPADLADFNLDEFDAKSVEDPEALVSSLQTLPFGADFRLVIVHGAETLAKPVSEALVSYLADPNPQSVLCLEAEKLAKNTRLYKAVAKVGPKSVVDCSPLKRWELPPYVVRLASRRGLAMGTDAAEELAGKRALVGRERVLALARDDALANGDGRVGHGREVARAGKQVLVGRAVPSGGNRDHRLVRERARERRQHALDYDGLDGDDHEVRCIHERGGVLHGMHATSLGARFERVEVPGAGVEVPRGNLATRDEAVCQRGRHVAESDETDLGVVEMCHASSSRSGPSS